MTPAHPTPPESSKITVAQARELVERARAQERELPDDLWEAVRACAAQLELDEGVCPTREQYALWQNENSGRAYLKAFETFGSWEEVAEAVDLPVLDGVDVRPVLAERRMSARRAYEERKVLRHSQAQEIKAEPFEGGVPVYLEMRAFGVIYVKAESIAEGVEIANDPLVHLSEDLVRQSIEVVDDVIVQSMDRQYG